jgi:hypothetical protein
VLVAAPDRDIRGHHSPARPIELFALANALFVRHWHTGATSADSFSSSLRWTSLATSSRSMDGVRAAVVGGWPYTSWPVSFVACSGGLKNILYSFGLGYGLSMASNAAIISAAIAPAAGGSSTLGLAGCSLYGCYGLRLGSFLMRRQSDDSYAPKFASVQQSSDKMGIVGRLGVVTFVSLTQALYALPLTAVAKPATRGGAIDTVSWAGVGLAVAGLLLEHFADEQKLAAKRSAPDEPVTSGLYKCALFARQQKVPS